MSDDFLYRTIPVLGKRVHRYGLSASYGLDEAGVREGLSGGPTTFFWSPAKKFLRTIIRTVVRPQPRAIRLGHWPHSRLFRGSVRRATEKALRASGGRLHRRVASLLVNRSRCCRSPYSPRW